MKRDFKKSQTEKHILEILKASLWNKRLTMYVYLFIL